jgi:predicted nucleic acid-binding protein
MSGNYRFVDTNVLVYAHDDSAGAKRDQARLLVEQLWDSREGCLSVQVLQEFFVTVTRKIARPLGPATFIPRHSTGRPSSRWPRRPFAFLRAGMPRKRALPRSDGVIEYLTM